LLGVICEDIIGGSGKAEEDLVVSKVNSGIVHFSASELNIRFTPNLHPSLASISILSLTDILKLGDTVGTSYKPR
jgi:hypothetical protein